MNTSAKENSRIMQEKMLKFSPLALITMGFMVSFLAMALSWYVDGPGLFTTLITAPFTIIAAMVAVSTIIGIAFLKYGSREIEGDIRRTASIMLAAFVPTVFLGMFEIIPMMKASEEPILLLGSVLWLATGLALIAAGLILRNWVSLKQPMMQGSQLVYSKKTSWVMTTITVVTLMYPWYMVRLIVSVSEGRMNSTIAPIITTIGLTAGIMLAMVSIANLITLKADNQLQGPATASMSIASALLLAVSFIGLAQISEETYSVSHMAAVTVIGLSFLLLVTALWRLAPNKKAEPATA